MTDYANNIKIKKKLYKSTKERYKLRNVSYILRIQSLVVNFV